LGAVKVLGVKGEGTFPTRGRLDSDGVEVQWRGPNDRGEKKP